MMKQKHCSVSCHSDFHINPFVVVVRGKGIKSVKNALMALLNVEVVGMDELRKHTMFSSIAKDVVGEGECSVVSVMVVALLIVALAVFQVSLP